MFLLPDEMVSHIASFLSLKDLYHFKQVSQRGCNAFKSVVYRTNFLTSDMPYARDVRSIFKDVIFEPMPEAIRWASFLKVSNNGSLENGSIEVHFRYRQHLRKIGKRTPIVETVGRIYCIQDLLAEEGKEFIPLRGELLIKDDFIHVKANTPLKVSGHIDPPFGIVIPAQSDFVSLTKKGKYFFSGLGLDFYKDIQTLATAIETFDETLYKTRTTDAYKLLENRKKMRFEKPYLFPTLQELCPKVCILDSDHMVISQTDYLSSDEPLIYRAKSLDSMQKLLKDLPELGIFNIYHINSDCSQDGIYCSGSLFLKKGFEISSQGDLAITGKFNFYEYYLKVNSQGLVWTNRRPS